MGVDDYNDEIVVQEESEDRPVANIGVVMTDDGLTPFMSVAHGDYSRQFIFSLEDWKGVCDAANLMLDICMANAISLSKPPRQADPSDDPVRRAAGMMLKSIEAQIPVAHYAKTILEADGQ